jgi:magnesium-transporting ATPase (P-type)
VTSVPAETGAGLVEPRRVIGLTRAEAAQRLAETGPNEIAREVQKPAWRLLLAQFNSPVIWLLLAACVVSAGLGEVADAVATGAIVIINALVGFFQEYRAERAVLALGSMTAPRARVIREGGAEIIAAADIVPGDVLILEAGDIVAGDAQVIEANLLSTMEAALTGKSTPVGKRVGASAPNAPSMRSMHNSVASMPMKPPVKRSSPREAAKRLDLPMVARCRLDRTNQKDPRPWTPSALASPSAKPPTPPASPQRWFAITRRSA